jgi:glycosyltransferase involved in cell wall biosynthesis
MLVKDNEATLAKAINSVRPYVDEVIVIDTGSTDESVRIAQELGANVYFYSWSEDFAEARNASLQYVKESDWVLVIDSDEEFIWHGPKSLREWLKEQQPDKTIVAFECFHYEISHPLLLSVTHAERLFSPAFFRFEGVIHEKLVSIHKRGHRSLCLCPHASFRHYGYSTEYHELKSDRNIHLLQKARENNPSEGLNYRYLANETYNVGKYIESIQFAVTALSLLSNTETYSRAQSHYYKIMALLHLGKNWEAEMAVKACMEELPSYSDPYGIIAEMCYTTHRWKEAIDWFEKWEQLLVEKSNLLPIHCISLIDTFRQHKWIAANKVEQFNRLNRKEVQKMKVAILINHPQLENDWGELLDHIQSKFEGLPYEIGFWEKQPQSKNAKELKSRLEQEGRVRSVEGENLYEVGGKLATDCKADIIWIWKANERLKSDLNEDAILSAISNNGAIRIHSYSERLGSQWTENRIMPTKLSSLSSDISSLQVASTREEETGEQPIIDDYITVVKPFIIPLDKQETHIKMYSEEAPLQQLLTAFACQRYEMVLEMNEPALTSAEWATFQFYKILASINLGKIEQTSEMIYNAIDNDYNKQNLLDFIYLYGKLAINVQIEDMKREAIEQFASTLQSNPMLATKHVLTTESDWLAVIAELYWQLGERKQAIRSWRHGLESSAFMNEGCAYRLAEAIYEEYKTAGIDKVAHAILEIFNVDSQAAQALLYPIYNYLNMSEWAVLFTRSREQSQNHTKRDEVSPLVSIILPVYNDTEYLFEGIRTVLSQTYLNLELIVVDDGSVENVEAIVGRFNYDGRLSFYKLNSNEGLPHALNYGISKAKGSIIGWTSADNYVHSRWLERMVCTISTHPNASAVYSDYYHIDEDGLVIETKRMPAYRLNGLQNGGPSLLWRASSLRKSGGFDESMFGIEDRDFVVRLALAGRIITLPEPLYYYRIHEKSLSSQIEAGSLGGWSELHDKLKRKWLYLSFV